MGMDLLAVSASADARRFTDDAFSPFNQDSWPVGQICYILAPPGYNLPPPGPQRAQIEKRAGAVIPGEYTCEGWLLLLPALAQWGVDTTSFPCRNIGEVISAESCREVADTLEAHLGEYVDLIYPHWDIQCALDEAVNDIHGWRTCGGYAVW